jgi:hypothetical protein
MASAMMCFGADSASRLGLCCGLRQVPYVRERVGPECCGIIATVPVPPFTNGLLPPILYAGSAAPEDMSPHRATMTEVVETLGSTTARAELIRGLLDLRRRLHEEGIVEGWQWLCGSFVEECEPMRGRSPTDIDLVTFGDLAPLSDEVVNELFGGPDSKPKYRCDSFAIDLVSLRETPRYTLETLTYFLQFFSHTRDREWKGILEVPLCEADDAQALLLLEKNDE